MLFHTNHEKVNAAREVNQGVDGFSGQHAGLDLDMGMLISCLLYTSDAADA